MTSRHTGQMISSIGCISSITITPAKRESSPAKKLGIQSLPINVVHIPCAFGIVGEEGFPPPENEEIESDLDFSLKEDEDGDELKNRLVEPLLSAQDEDASKDACVVSISFLYRKALLESVSSAVDK